MIPVALRAALSSNEELVDFETVRVAGVTELRLAQLLRSGELIRIRRGVYTTGEYWEALTEAPQRELLRARAASMRIGVAHVFSHDSAAHALGMAFLMPRRSYVHVTRPPVNGSRHETGVKHHTARYLTRQVLQIGAIHVLDRARTAVDIARQHGMLTGVSACDSALRQGVTRADLRAAVAPMSYWRGVNAARTAISWADPGAENPGESLARMLVVEAGYGRPLTQFPVNLGTRVAWCDMVVGAHAVEFDGRVKYQRPAEGGVAQQDPGDVVWNERLRERALIDAGLGVSRLTWEDTLPRNWDRSRARLMAEIGQTVRRVGFATPSHLLEFAQRMQTDRLRRLHGAPRSASV